MNMLEKMRSLREGNDGITLKEYRGPTQAEVDEDKVIKVLQSNYIDTKMIIRGKSARHYDIYFKKKHNYTDQKLDSLLKGVGVKKWKMEGFTPIMPGEPIGFAKILIKNKDRTDLKN